MSVAETIFAFKKSILKHYVCAQLSIQIEFCGLWSQTLFVFETNIKIKEIFLTISLKMLALKCTTIVPAKSVKITWYSMSTICFCLIFVWVLFNVFVSHSFKVPSLRKFCVGFNKDIPLYETLFFWPSIKKFVAFETKYLSVFETIFMLPST